MRPDDNPPVPDLMPLLINRTCKAVACYIGETFGWKIVINPWSVKERETLQKAWSALPTASQRVIERIAKNHGYNSLYADRLLPLSWLTRRQNTARAESIVKIAMQAIADPEWLK